MSGLTPDQLEAVLTWASTWPEIYEVWLFGSRATGAARATSDVDLALKIIPPVGETERSAYENRLMDLSISADDALHPLVADLWQLWPGSPRVAAAVAEHGRLLYRTALA